MRDNMDQEKIGKFISKLRKEKNMTQEQLAEKLNTTSKSISRWENGKTMPDYSIIKLLCDELGITVNELLSGEKIKEKNYELKADENLNIILKEYYKMKKQKNIVKTCLICLIILFILFVVRILFVVGIVYLSTFIPAKTITGVENYDKTYYLEEYGGDLDSNLSIFPDDILNLKDSEFSSSFQTNFFDSDGYILLITKYDKNDFDNEINRIKKLNETIYENCKGDSKTFTNYVKYDDKMYKYPAYITIDGYGHTYEYALINENDLEIIYVYLSYPKTYNSKYKNYLKLDKSIYNKNDTLEMYSMYNHTFDNGSTYMEFGDCGRS